MKKTKVPKGLQVMLLLCCMTAVFSLPQGAEAMIFKVNSTTDAVDAAPGDGLCDTGSGVCTLRAAIQEANALPGADVIKLKAGVYRLSRAGEGEDFAATGDLDITDSVTIRGKGAALTVVEGELRLTDRVFQVFGATTVAKFIGLKIMRGVAGPAELGGGGIYNLGATVIVKKCIITNNSAFGQAGGGILSSGGNLKVVSSRVAQNQIYIEGRPAVGGGIASVADKSLKIIGTRILNNIAANVTGPISLPAFGGGVAISNTSTVEITSCKILGNVTYGESRLSNGGAGIAMSLVPSANVSDTKIANNTCAGSTLGTGGGVYAQASNATFSGCTITENSAFAFGGGLFLEKGTDPMAITINNLTSIMYNYAALGGGIYNHNGAVTLTIATDSVVANNLDNDILP